VLRFDVKHRTKKRIAQLNRALGRKQEIQMKTIILAVLAALSFGLTGVASADGHTDRNSTFPEGSIQVSAE
jgi:hypothetical protein